MQLRGLEPQLHAGPRTHHLAAHIVEDLLQREVRSAEGQARRDGQVGPILDIVEGAQQLLQHLVAQLGCQVGTAQVADEGAHVVAHHTQTGLHIGDALHIAPLGLLELPFLAPQAQGVAPQEHRQHQQQQGQHPEDHGRVGHPAAAACGGGQRLLQHKILLLALLDMVLQLHIVLKPAQVLVGALGQTAAYQHVEVAQLHLGGGEGLPRAAQRPPLLQHLVGLQRVAYKQGIARRAGGAAQHLVGVAIVEESHPRAVVERQHTVGRHGAGQRLQGPGGHLQRVGIMIQAEDRRVQVEQAEILVAVVEGNIALAGTLPAIGERIVQRHILRIVHLQLLAPRLHLVEQGAHIGLLAVAVVVVEHQHGDVVLGLGVAVE